jgi:enoyl-CoA hydratase
MAMMLTGDSITGVDAARLGWANAAFPADELDERVVAYAERIAKMPMDLIQLNKRLVHRTMEVMGLRTAIRVGTEICALGVHQKTLETFLADIRANGLTDALNNRDSPFGDYRTSTSE